MRTVLIAAAVALAAGSAFAQNTGPQPQTNTTKPGVNHMERSSGNHGQRGSMSTGTTGMARGGVRPDASGQGGSGPGSDQGGTRVSPGDRR
ncbi:hypothetical protein ACVIW0_006949 [Bradyrhizobium sp. USDA 4454]